MFLVFPTYSNFLKLFCKIILQSLLKLLTWNLPNLYCNHDVSNRDEYHLIRSLYDRLNRSFVFGISYLPVNNLLFTKKQSSIYLSTIFYLPHNNLQLTCEQSSVYLSRTWVLFSQTLHHTERLRIHLPSAIIIYLYDKDHSCSIWPDPDLEPEPLHYHKAGYVINTHKFLFGAPASKLEMIYYLRICVIFLMSE